MQQSAVTDIHQLDPNGTYSYADYLTWSFEEYVELFRGKISRMSPAPVREHQRILLRISSILEQFLRGKRCEVYIAPIDVRLPKSGNSDVTITAYKLNADSKYELSGAYGEPGEIPVLSLPDFIMNWEDIFED